MKYVRIVSDKTSPCGDYGIVRGDRVSLLCCSPLQGRAVETGVEVGLEEVSRFLPPAEPPVIVALGLNYAGHARESGMDLPSEPVVFLKSVTALTGHLQPIVLPPEHRDEVDYEAELTVVIGKKAKYLERGEVSDYIFGYTCGNDVSARDCQMRSDRQWARAKSFDTFAPAGPFIETGLDPSALRISTRLNGRLMQDSSTSDMVFDVPEVVSYLSKQMTLLPGTFIMTGTPAGVGYGRDPRVFLKAGDVVEVEIEGAGVLKNPVAEETCALKRKTCGCL